MLLHLQTVVVMKSSANDLCEESEKGENNTTVHVKKMEINMNQQDEKVVLCASSKYEEKYYLNPAFDGLPDSIKDELQAMCVLFTEDIGGILTLEFDEDANLNLVTMSAEGDLLYDEIGCVLKIKQIQSERRELMESLELYYRVFFLGETLEDK